MFPRQTGPGCAGVVPSGVTIVTVPADTNSGDTPTLTDQEYFEERKLLLGARQRGYQRADRMITGGATGALVLSIAFLRNLDSVAGLQASKWWLIIAWVLLLLTLLLSLLSNYASAKGFDVEILRLESRLHGEPLPANPWAARARRGGPIIAVLFVVGIAVLAFFVYANAPFQPQG